MQICTAWAWDHRRNSISETWGKCFMFVFVLFFVQLAKGMETPCRQRWKKKTESQETRGRQQWWEIRKAHFLLTTSVALMQVCFDCVMALCVQTQTGTAQKTTPRMERTCCVIRCLSRDPRALERLLQSMLVPRSWASRYIRFEVHYCETLSRT